MTKNVSLLSTLERRNRELEVLIEIGKALTSTLDLDEDGTTFNLTPASAWLPTPTMPVPRMG